MLSWRREPRSCQFDSQPPLHAEVSRLIAGYLSSGLSLKAFCQQQDLDRSESPGQRQNVAGQNTQPPCRGRVELTPEPDPVSVAAPSGMVLVVAGGRRIELARHFDAATLHQLLHVLESR